MGKIINRIKNSKNKTFIFLTALLLALNLIINFTIYRGDVFDVHFPWKDMFGASSFVITTVVGLIFSNLIYLGMKKKIRLENLYLIIAIPIGLLFMFCNPLGKVPDEDMHARKAYAISYGNLFSIANEEGRATAKMNPKLEKMVARSVSSYKEARSLIDEDENKPDKLLEYSTMALYSPICHMPQGLGMLVSRTFGANIVIQCYFARLFNLSLSIFLMYMAIKIMPFKKIILFVIGSLPITMNEFASMSSDALAISFGIFYISYILWLKSSEGLLTKKQKILLVIFSIIMALLKIVYVPVVFMLLLIPKEKYESKGKRRKFLICTIVAAIIINLIWLAYCSRFLVEYNPGVNGEKQVVGILKNPLGYVFIMFRTLNTYAQTFILSLCGEGLGHYNVQTSVLYVFSALMLFTVLFFAREETETVEFAVFDKVVCIIIFLAITALIYTSLYVQWTEALKPIILGVQARYFIPIMPLAALIIDNKNLIIKKWNKACIALFMLFFNLNAICMILFTYIDGNVLNFYIK